jgi:protein-L-isoaspartate(D-aspartate) O-methyltransferase
MPDPLAPDPFGPDPFSEARRQLLEDIGRHTGETRAWTGRERLSDRVMAAMARVPRHAFVPEAEADVAYLDRPLPIGHGQTISQPFIVAMMTELLAVEPHHRVLEIGSGCGYQTAVLAELASRVFAIERVGALAEAAAERLQRLGYANVEMRQGDGYLGWPEAAPFDRILVAAAPADIPPALIEQLKPGGRLVMPVGRDGDSQSLVLGSKHADGRFETERLLPVSFVPLVPGEEA